MQQLTDRTLLKRLEQRKRENEDSIEEVVQRLLNESINEIKLGSVIETVVNRFADIVSITIGHQPTHYEPAQINIAVCTKDAAKIQKPLPLFSPDHQIPINRANQTNLTPFTIQLGLNGPLLLNTKHYTTIYLSGNLYNKDPVKLYDGLAYLEYKFRNPNQWSQTPEKNLEQIRNFANKD